MNRYTTTSILSVIAFIALIQPCPAPPLALAIAGGAIAAGASGAVAGGVSGAVNHHGRRNTDESSTFAQCVSDAANSGSHPVVEAGPGTSVLIQNVPQSCMAQIDAYNAHPDITQLNMIHGTTTKVNGTTVTLDGMPAEVMTTIDKLIKSPPSQGPKRRSLRFERD